MSDLPLASENLDVFEVSLQPTLGGQADILAGRPPLHCWSIPRDLLRERDLEPGDVVFVRSPTSLYPTYRTGDRLLVDVSAQARRPSPPGDVILWDGESHYLARIRLSGPGALRISSAGGVDEVAVEDVEIAGRVVAFWQWS